MFDVFNPVFEMATLQVFYLCDDWQNTHIEVEIMLLCCTNNTKEDRKKCLDLPKTVFR